MKSINVKGDCAHLFTYLQDCDNVQQQYYKHNEYSTKKCIENLLQTQMCDKYINLEKNRNETRIKMDHTSFPSKSELEDGFNSVMDDMYKD